MRYFLLLALLAMTACADSPTSRHRAGYEDKEICGTAMLRAEPSIIVDYIEGAELQAESDAQRKELAAALKDATTRPVDVAKLKAKRYRDYSGKAGAWSLPELLKKYYVPAKPTSLGDEAAFYKDLMKPQAQAALRRALNRLNSPSANDPN